MKPINKEQLNNNENVLKPTGYESQWNETFGLDKDPVREYVTYPVLDREAGQLTGKAILDAGCGNGGLMYHLRNQPYSKVVGIDRSPEFLDSARKLISDERVQFIQGSLLEKWPFADQSFDLIYSIFVINEMASLDHFMRESSRVLRANGRLLIIAPHPFYALYCSLYEQFTGKPDNRIMGIKNYFDKSPGRCTFTLIKATGEFYQHTFEDLVNPLISAGLELTKVVELKTDDPRFQGIAKYWESKDMPRYIFLSAQKNV